MPTRTPASRSQRPTSSSATSRASSSRSARVSVGAAAAYPSSSRSANPSSRTSTARGGSGPAGAACAARAAARSASWSSGSPAHTAVPSASRCVSRAVAGSSGVRCRAELSSSRAASRPRAARPAGAGQVVEPVQHPGQQLMQPGVGQLHLGLDAGRAGHPVAGGLSCQVVQQRRLAHAGVAPQHQHAALPALHGREQLVELGTLALPAAQLHRSPARGSPAAGARHPPPKVVPPKQTP